MSDRLVPRSDVGEFRKRYQYMALFAFLAFLTIAVRLFQLQVIEGKDYAARAHENVIRRVTLPTTRGVVRDANGRVLASSRGAFNVYIVPGRVMPSARPPRRWGKDERDSFPLIADTLRLNPDERARLTARIREACKTDEDKSPCWHSILVREDVPRDIVAELKQHSWELVGSSVLSAPVRLYPYKNLGSHLLGYVAQVDAETLAKFRPDDYKSMSAEDRAKVNPLGYAPGDTLGATGIERSWEAYLRGQRGWEKRVVDARGRYRTGPDAERLLDAPKRQEPLAGRDLRLTIDMDLMEGIEKAMRNEVSGAVVVVDVRTGRLLALYSKPDFDPNDLSGGAGRERVRETFNKLYADSLRPMLDKTMSGAFQPGSTFKPFSALAALEAKLVNPAESERCDGYLLYGRRVFRCSHVHGRVNMHGAIAQSCNVYFYKLGETVGIDRLAHIGAEFGLGQKTGLGINPEAQGRVPTRSWYSLRYHGQFRIGYTLNSAIGQGATTVTPLQLGLAYAAIANGGTVYTPQAVRAIESSDGAVLQDFPPRVRQRAHVTAANLKRVTEALYAVVNEEHGTAYPVRDTALDMAGKTGTAQTGYIATGKDDAKKAWFLAKDHAWFASFAPYKSPEVAVIVLVEHGGSGPTIAAPIAVKVVREYTRLRALRSGKPALPGPTAPKPRPAAAPTQPLTPGLPSPAPAQDDPADPLPPPTPVVPTVLPPDEAPP
jgi:penicillin-binding protein 2